MYSKLIISLALINFVYISSSDCYVASNYPQDDIELRRGYGGSGGSQRGVKGGSRRGNVIEATTGEGTNDNTGNVGYYPFRARPYPSPVDSTRSRTEDDAGGSRYRGYGSRDTHDGSAFGQRQESSRTDGQTRYQDRPTGRYDTNRGSSLRQDSNEFSRNDYRGGQSGRSEGNEDLNRGNYMCHGIVDSSDSRYTSGYRGYGSGSNPELTSGSFRVDGNSRVDESRTSGQRLSSDTDVPVPSSGVKTKTKRINYIGQGEPGIHY
ncbi:PREDICTED: uncharacterized protein LOC108568879 [Nicrophorus vespilloides]|uniref:Uncharacterized protein LOC108568879 n=1 Tax=Nicrophorus vespilloides TaxID=110193 RepID=A0ABM1NFW5_NICVS|nr:PREDICTED: uncharacterized protein LOC108568879 [Nicrophorus vespilloides]